MSNEYPIASLEDFLKVPEDKIDECLADFKIWLSLARQSNVVTSVFDALSGMPGWTTKFLHSFTWIDDGTPGIRAVQITDANDQTRVRVDIATD